MTATARPRLLDYRVEGWIKSALEEKHSPGKNPVRKVLREIFWRSRAWFPRLKARRVWRENKALLAVANHGVVESRTNMAQARLDNPDFGVQIGFARALVSANDSAKGSIEQALRKSGYL